MQQRISNKLTLGELKLLFNVESQETVLRSLDPITPAGASCKRSSTTSLK